MEWPKEALLGVSKSFFESVDLGSDELKVGGRAGVLQVCVCVCVCVCVREREREGERENVCVCV